MNIDYDVFWFGYLFSLLHSFITKLAQNNLNRSLWNVTTMIQKEKRFYCIFITLIDKDRSFTRSNFQLSSRFARISNEFFRNNLEYLTQSSASFLSLIIECRLYHVSVFFFGQWMRNEIWCLFTLFALINFPHSFDSDSDEIKMREQIFILNSWNNMNMYEL